MLSFLGKKFEWKPTISQKRKIKADILFKVVLFFVSLYIQLEWNHFLIFTGLYFLVLSIYLMLYKRGSFLEKFYWVTLIQCISSCALLLSYSIVMQVPVSFLYSLYKCFGIVISFLLIILLLLIEYFSLYIVTKFVPKLRYLSTSILASSIFVNIFCLLATQILYFVYDKNVALLTVVLLLLSYTIHFLIMESLSKNMDKLAHIEFENQNMRLKAKYYEEVEIINQEVRRYKHDFYNHLNLLYYYLDKDDSKEAKSYVERLITDLKKVNKNFYFIKSGDQSVDYHLNLLYYYLDKDDSKEAKSYVERLITDLKKVNKNFYFIKSGDQSVDYILNSKLLIAKEQGIRVNATVGSLSDLYLNKVDICTLLANLLDNSIEACQLFKKQNPFIDINFQLIKNNYVINIKNSSNPVNTDDSGRYLTNKKGSNHGLGLLQIDRIIEQYEGFISRKYENDVFETDILLSKPKEF